MFVYEKKLQYPVRIANPNPKLAAFIISQYGGPDGELGASLRYLSQRYSMPYPELKAGGGQKGGIRDVFCGSHRRGVSHRRLRLPVERSVHGRQGRPDRRPDGGPGRRAEGPGYLRQHPAPVRRPGRQRCHQVPAGPGDRAFPASARACAWPRRKWTRRISTSSTRPSINKRKNAPAFVSEGRGIFR